MPGIVEQVRGVLWARRRAPENVRYVVALALKVYEEQVLPELRN